jgi:hypothetical protein
MTTAHTADAWQPGGGRSERSFAAPRSSRSERMGSDRMTADRMAERVRSDRVASDRMAERMRSDRLGFDRGTPDRMGPDRMSRDRMGPERSSRPVRTGAPQARGAGGGRNAGYPRVSQGGRPLDSRASARGADQDLGVDRGRSEERRPSARPSDGARPRSQAAPVEASGGRLRGTVAVLGVFLITLAGAGADSFVGIGLGMITLVCLVASTVFATLLVRRRDLISVVVAPPLVFVAVAAVNIGLAPSAHFNLPTIATLLVRGFPTMAIATAAAIVLALFRLVARR